MAETLSTQLEVLMRERDRLEQLLMLDVNWRALRELEEREGAAHPEGAETKARLVAALASNRIYAARAKLIETIELLADAGASESGTGTARPGTLASRIVMLDDAAADPFKTQLRIKPDTPDPQAADRGPAAACKGSGVPDALEMIEGLGRQAAEVLLSHGVTSFAEIARWSSTDVVTWRARLDGLTFGPPSGWIEQAAVLASGRQTRYAARVRRGEFAALVPAPASPPSTISADGSAFPAATELEPRTPPPPLPPLRSAAAATGANGTDHITSAEDLIRVLAEPAPATAATASAIAAQVEPSSGKMASGEETVVSPGSQPGLQTAGPVRPAAPPHPPDPEGEVVVASTPSSDTPDAQGEGRMQTNARGPGLVRRLEQASERDRFDADRYAAYRGVIEEASVTIIRPEEGRSAPDTLTAVERKAALDRFLKALDGKN